MCSTLTLGSVSSNCRPREVGFAGAERSGDDGHQRRDDRDDDREDLPPRIGKRQLAVLPGVGRIGVHTIVSPSARWTDVGGHRHSLVAVGAPPLSGRWP